MKLFLAFCVSLLLSASTVGADGDGHHKNTRGGHEGSSHHKYHGPAVTGFELIDAETDTSLGPLADGDVVEVNPEAKLSVRALTKGYVKSLKFGLDGNANHRVEEVDPYALFGNEKGGKYLPWAPQSNVLGTHTITATPYPLPKAGGRPGTARVITFTLIPHKVLLEECETDCDVDEDCVPDLLCADEHKAELALAGQDIRKAYCGKDVGLWNYEVCFDPNKIEVCLTTKQYPRTSFTISMADAEWPPDTNTYDVKPGPCKIIKEKCADYFLNKSDEKLFQCALDTEAPGVPKIGKYCYISDRVEKGGTCAYYAKGQGSPEGSDGIPNGTGCIVGVDSYEGYCWYAVDSAQNAFLSQTERDSMCTDNYVTNGAYQIRYGILNGYCGMPC